MKHPDLSMLNTGSNKNKTRILFWELCYKEGCVFTLSGEEKDGLCDFKNLYRHYTEEDPTEFRFAEAVFGSWARWLRVANCWELKPHLEELRVEKEAKVKAKATESVIQSLEDPKTRLAAAKHLLGGTLPKPKEKEKANSKLPKVGGKDLNDDYKRVFSN